MLYSSVISEVHDTVRICIEVKVALANDKSQTTDRSGITFTAMRENI